MFYRHNSIRVSNNFLARTIQYERTAYNLILYGIHKKYNFTRLPTKFCSASYTCIFVSDMTRQTRDRLSYRGTLVYRQKYISRKKAVLDYVIIFLCKYCNVMVPMVENKHKKWIIYICDYIMVSGDIYFNMLYIK